ncbi:hypothetical protein CO038_00440 [Candidatus Pacearchaeota archaeon CG_4_9_14_0_2_um_filter_39_13]|nr:hypothetical protein [Candidatus Pacearchaeota archaeon]PJC45063.1 MAG: hypothetical protein CO038_00440 [Candidatus Pacearchaeota archaeon CG_4_9_14_0_2_um_filter_39_13]
MKNPELKPWPNQLNLKSFHSSTLDDRVFFDEVSNRQSGRSFRNKYSLPDRVIDIYGTKVGYSFWKRIRPVPSGKRSAVGREIREDYRARGESVPNVYFCQ